MDFCNARVKKAIEISRCIDCCGLYSAERIDSYLYKSFQVVVDRKAHDNTHQAGPARAELVGEHYARLKTRRSEKGVTNFRSQLL